MGLFKVSPWLQPANPLLEVLTTHRCFPQSFKPQLMLKDGFSRRMKMTVHVCSTLWFSKVSFKQYLFYIGV